MDYSDKRIREEADKLFKENDPRCINHYAALKNDYGRSRLALIFLEGRCGQPVDIEKAFTLSRNNSQYLARAIQAHIYLFNIGCSDSEALSFYRMLTNIHDAVPNHPMVNQVLSTLYLQGKVVAMDFAKAVDINPRLLRQNVFDKAMSELPPEILPALLSQIESYEDRNWSKLVKVFNESYPKSTINLPEIIPHIDENSSYKERIEYYFSSKNYDKASEIAKKWYSEEKTEESSYYALKHALKSLSTSEYENACDILAGEMHKNRNMKCILESARARGDWDRVEICLSSEYASHNMYDYDRGCLEDHRGNIELACFYYLKSVYRDPKNNRYTRDSYEAISRVFTLRPETILQHRDYADILLSSHKTKYTLTVGTALYDVGTESDQQRAKQLLIKICNVSYPAASKLYEITGEQQYSDLANSLKPIGDKKSNYHFSYSDSTKTIEENYQDLPPLFKIRALDELSKRYQFGKRDVKIDYEKTKDYLLQEIEICEENHIISKFAKAKLGLMMYEKKIQCISEKQMFEYIYPLRNNSGYSVAVATCLIDGIGTEKNIKEAITILSSSDSPHVLRKLMKIYDKGKTVPRDDSKIYTLLKQILQSSEPTEYEINVLRTLSPESTSQSEEISYSRYQRSKINALIKIAKEQNAYNAIRYYDFARKCGSRNAAISEANLLLKEFKKEELAYSILKISGADPQDELFLRIKPHKQVLVNVDEELSKFLSLISLNNS